MEFDYLNHQIGHNQKVFSGLEDKMHQDLPTTNKLS